MGICLCFSTHFAFRRRSRRRQRISQAFVAPLSSLRDERRQSVTYGLGKRCLAREERRIKCVSAFHDWQRQRERILYLGGSLTSGLVVSGRMTISGVWTTIAAGLETASSPAGDNGGTASSSPAAFDAAAATVGGISSASAMSLHHHRHRAQLRNGHS